MKFFARWLLTTLTILAVPYIVTGVEVDGVGTALVAALLLGVLNFTIKPILILFTLPLTLVTFGLFLFVINALVFQIAGGLLSGLHVASFGSAFLASLMVSSVTWMTNLGIEDRQGKRTIVIERGPNGRLTRDLN